MVLESLESGTRWPSTNPAATSARKDGQGLFTETVVAGGGASLETVPTLSNIDKILKTPNESQSPRSNGKSGVFEILVRRPRAAPDAQDSWRNSNPSQPMAADPAGPPRVCG